MSTRTALERILEGVITEKKIKYAYSIMRKLTNLEHWIKTDIIDYHKRMER